MAMLRYVLVTVLAASIGLLGATELAGAAPPLHAPIEGYDVEPVERSALRERIVQLVEHDQGIRDRLALRRGTYHAEVFELVPTARRGPQLGIAQSSNDARPLERAYVVSYSQRGEMRLDVVVDHDVEQIIRTAGQTLVIMPTRTPATFDVAGAWQSWLPLVVLFSFALFAGQRPSRATLVTAAPLAVLTAAFVITMSAVVPSTHVWSANVLLFAAAWVTLLVSAALWSLPRRARDRCEGPRSLGARWFVGIAAIAVACTVVLAVRIPFMVDVGYASEAGATLMAAGATVYGNVLDVPGFLHAGDTYGPAAYLAYVPAVHLIESSAVVVQSTNIALFVLVAVLLIELGRRRGDLVGGARAAALWCSCPLVAVPVATGNNDIVVAAAMAGFALLAGRPAARGIMVGIAAGAKYVPIALVAALVRRAQPPGSAIRAVFGLAAALTVLFGIGLRGGTEVGAFYDAAVTTQAGRDDIASLPGMLGAPALRVVCIALVVVLAAYTALDRTGGERVVLLRGAALLGLVLCALPMYWGSYCGCLVPLLVAADLHARPQRRLAGAPSVETSLPSLAPRAACPETSESP